MKILMFKNTPVLSFNFNKKHYVENIYKVFDYDLLPFDKADSNYTISLQRWFNQNRLSLKRKDIQTAISFFGRYSIEPIHFTSLFHEYWIKDSKEDITWEFVNPKENWDMYYDNIDLLTHYPYMIVDGDSDIEYDSLNYTCPINNTSEEIFIYKEKNEFYLLTKIKGSLSTENNYVIWNNYLWKKEKINM